MSGAIGDNVFRGSGVIASAGAGGGLLQIKQTVVTTSVEQTGSTGNFVDLTAMAVSITPTLSTSKILIYLDAKICATPAAYGAIVRLMRDDTAIYVSTDALSSQLAATAGASPSGAGGVNNPFLPNSMFIDAPASTSAISYNMEWAIETSTTCYLNRTSGNVNGSLYWRAASSLTAMEIAAGVL